MKLKQHFLKRFTAMCLGIFFLGLIVPLFIKANLGNDSYSTLILGLEKVTPLSFGTALLISNCLMMVAMLIWSRHLIGIGTLFNMTIIGFLTDFFLPLYQFDLSDNLVGRVLLMLFSTVAMSFAAALYIVPDLGISPYDALGFILTAKTKIHFRWCRIATDSLCVLGGFLLGATVGVATIITALLMGPLVSFFSEKVVKPMLGVKNEE